MQPWPIASTLWHKPDGKTARLIVHQARAVKGDGEPGKVLEAGGSRIVIAAGEGAVQLLRVQLEGKKPVPAEEFLHGHHPYGDRMGD